MDNLDLYMQPRKFLKQRYGWDLTESEFDALSNRWNDNIHDLVWYLWGANTELGPKAFRLTINTILNTKEYINPTVLKFYVLDLLCGTFSKQDGKDVLNRVTTGENYFDIINDPKYKKVDGIEYVVAQIVSENADKIDGSDKVKNWLVGQVMKAVSGRCDPQEVRELIDKASVAQ